MWNFTVRTVMLSFDAISLFARLQSTERRISFCLGLRDLGLLASRPWSRRSFVREMSCPESELSAGIRTAKSSGSSPRTRHCMANKLAIRSRVFSEPAYVCARNCATPVAFSQKTKRLGCSVSCCLTCWTGFANARTLFNVDLPVLAPGVSLGEAVVYLLQLTKTTKRELNSDHERS